MFTQPPLALPTVFTKNEARASQDDTSGNKLSVADSLVLLQSLKQSRSMWLTKAFLRFSTRSKNKADQVYPAPPPHSLSLAGSCDFEIGPHLFPNTKIFFVQYRYGQTSVAATTSAPVPVPTPAPVANHPPPITVSHELHAKVLTAASKDPDLHHILQLASQGRANVTQLRALGTAIKAIEAGTYLGPTGAPSTPHASPAPVATVSRAEQTQSVPIQAPSAQPRPVATTAPPASSTQTPASAPRDVATPSAAPPPKATTAPTPIPNAVLSSTPTPSTHVPAPAPAPARVTVPPTIPTTAVLLEFAERPIDRWLLPTEYVLIDRRPNGDIHLSTFYPFDAYVPAGGAMRSKPAHPITMRFIGASGEIWNALSRTCTTVTQENVQAILAEVITNVPQRTYLQYRIAPGALWSDIKTANPHAQSFLLPSKTPIPITTTARQRRMDSITGGSAPKKRKTDPGDSIASKPKAKGKEKDKEAESTPSAGPSLAPTNQPAAEPAHQPQAITPNSNNMPPASASQIPAPVTPNMVGPTSKVATIPTSTPNASVPKPMSVTSTPLVDTPATTTSRPSLGKGTSHSARNFQTSDPNGSAATPNNTAGPLSHPQHPALTQTSLPSQQDGRSSDQNTSVDSLAAEGKSQR
ncbi:hypothetical protein OPQ81_008978 [Rhizoctonia solani]|nr:hypothetical protein OPQ81_008978 [Rhizoctonia solani]